MEISQSQYVVERELTNRSLAVQNETEELVRQNTVSFNIYYKDLTYKLISDVPQQNWLNFIAACGGLLGGSLVGMSLLSVVEFIEISARILIIVFKKFAVNFK